VKESNESESTFYWNKLLLLNATLIMDFISHNHFMVIEFLLRLLVDDWLVVFDFMTNISLSFSLEFQKNGGGGSTALKLCDETLKIRQIDFQYKCDPLALEINFTLTLRLQLRIVASPLKHSFILVPYYITIAPLM
jgi:hypothetical protein